MTRIPAILAGLFLAAVAVAGAWGLTDVVRGAHPRPTATPEADHIRLARQQAFDTRLARVTESVVASLEARGVDRSDVVTSTFDARSEEELAWRRELLELDVPGEPEELAADLAERLTDVEGAHHTLTSAGDEAMALSVTLDDHETHRLVVHPLRPRGNPRMAIIIDDIGYRRKEAEGLIALDASLTFAVLPDGPYSKRLAALASRQGREVMLHLPLEPDKELDTVLPEEVLSADLPPALLRARVRDALVKVPQAVGMNNHMGSAFTRDRDAMRVVLTEIAERDMYFIDSRTTADTVGLSVARELGLPSSERDVFLDDDQSYEATVAAIDEGRKEALERGRAILIGHPYPTTLQALRDTVPRLQAEGIEIVSAGDLATTPLVLGAEAVSPGP